MFLLFFGRLEGHSWRPFLAEVTILKVLHRLDKNGDGSVSKEEFERVFSELNWENFVEGVRKNDIKGVWFCLRFFF
jgi:hypothetical protein